MKGTPDGGVPLAELMPELAGQGFITPLDEVYRTGEPYTGLDARVVLGAGPHAREAFFDFTYEPRRDGAGKVAGISVIGVETSQGKHAQRLMAEHRALAEQIARQAPLAEVRRNGPPYREPGTAGGAHLGTDRRGQQLRVYGLQQPADHRLRWTPGGDHAQGESCRGRHVGDPFGDRGVRAERATGDDQ